MELNLENRPQAFPELSRSSDHPKEEGALFGYVEWNSDPALGDI
jgi:hypothetical protein